MSRIAFVLALAGAVAAGTPAPAAAQTPPATDAVQPFVRNLTRAEFWRFYDPPPASASLTPGDPTTGHLANRLLTGVRLRNRRIEATVALQYVQFLGLPDDAIGPGALGTGALYFDHSGDSASRQLFLKSANVAFRGLGGGLDVQIGRMPYTGGAERSSGVPKIEAVKRQRIDSRLIGEFEWSLYQRAYDGVRVDWRSGQYQLTGLAAQPTQGGFEEAAGVSMSGVRVYSGILTTAPGPVVPGVELQLFGHGYRDHRPVRARPDNTGRAASAADIDITTLGGHLVGSRPSGTGELDGLLWAAAQFGSWYDQDHRAFGVAAEGGYQWKRRAWTPWARAGVTWLSGDRLAGDDTHGTFFPMLPTVRRYSLSTLYSLANLRDVMAQLMLQPRGNIAARVDVHLVGLASSADRWYGGSGATQESGRIFGYTTRSSGGRTRLMEVVEGSLDWRLDPRWSVNGYVGVASRGPVVAATFADGPAVFTYLETVVQF